MSETQRVTSYTHGNLIFDVIDIGPINGEIILLLHGWPLTANSWLAVAEILNTYGYRTIIPHQRGYSPQANPKSIMSYRIGELSSDIVSLIRLLGIGSVHIVGHDWGATIAWHLSAKHPELVRTLTSISVPHSGALVRAMLSSDQLFRVYHMGLFQIPKLPEFFAIYGRPIFKKILMGTGLTTAQVETVYAEVIDRGLLPGSLKWYQAMFMISPVDLFHKVTVPTMYIWGDQDSALSYKSAELTEKFVTGPYQLEIMEGATHWIPIQEPERLAILVIKSFSAG